MVTTIDRMGDDVARRMSKMVTAVRSDTQPTSTAAALAATKVHRDAIRRDAGGDSRLSGVGRRGARVGARFDRQSDGIVIKATGPLVLIERDTPPHRIPRVRGPRARRRYAVIPGVGVRAYANHPGTRGKGTWRKSTPKAQNEATKVMRARTFKAIKDAFT